MIAAAALLGGSYLAGAIPTGYWLGRALRGIDVREHGSGNIGAANVYRTIGRAAGLATLVVDAAKGAGPVLAARALAPELAWLPAACGAIAIAGHVWTVFLRFRGGKGVATAAGVFVALVPLAMLPAVVVFGVAAGLSRHVSVGSLAAALTLPAAAALLGAPPVELGLAILAALLIVVRHAPNLRRLREGRELPIRERGGRLPASKGDP